MKNKIKHIFMALFFVFLSHGQVFAEVYTQPFIGMSGSSFMIYLADMVLDADGKIIDKATEYGLFTGEVGMLVGYETDYMGLRVEGFFGTYRYHVIKIPNVEYSMRSIGIEPYFKMKNLLLGAGAGLFAGYMKDEAFGKTFNKDRTHLGASYWCMTGYRVGDAEFSARFRWHHFIKVEERREKEYLGRKYENFTDDYVVVIRMGYNI